MCVDLLEEVQKYILNSVTLLIFLPFCTCKPEFKSITDQRNKSMGQWNIRKLNIYQLSMWQLKWHIHIFGWKRVVSQIIHWYINKNKNIFSFDIICAHIDAKKMLPNKLKHRVYNKCTNLCVFCRVTKYLKTKMLKTMTLLYPWFCELRAWPGFLLLHWAMTMNTRWGYAALQVS